MAEETKQDAEKATSRIKDVGTFSQILGWWKIIAATILPAMFASDTKWSEFFSYSYTDFAINIVLGIALIIVGGRINKIINKSTKKYLWIVLVLTGIFGLIHIANTGKAFSLMILLAGYTIYALSQFKNIKISEEQVKYKIAGSKWIIVAVAFIVIVGIGLALELNQYGYFINPDNLTIPDTDKNSDHSEQIGNLYRNNKYNFRIKFPEDWNQLPGDGPHILQKAVYETCSISVGVQEFPAEYKNLGYGIRDFASEEEYFDEIKNSFPGAQLIDSGFTKIDNKDAFYIEYTAPYQALDIKVVGRNKQWQAVYNGALYMITIGGLKDEYPMCQNELLTSVSTFVFEN